MTPTRRLHIYLTEESKAYGYTLCIWGSGAVLMNQFELLPMSVLLYVTGAVLGFTVLSFVAYRGFFVEVERRQEETVIVASMIHYLAALGTVGLAYFLTYLDSAPLAFLIAGINATTTYNVLMLAEVVLSREIQKLEDMLRARLSRYITAETDLTDKRTMIREKYLTEKYTE